MWRSSPPLMEDSPLPAPRPYTGAIHGDQQTKPRPRVGKSVLQFRELGKVCIDLSIIIDVLEIPQKLTICIKRIVGVANLKGVFQITIFSNKPYFLKKLFVDDTGLSTTKLCLLDII